MSVISNNVLAGAAGQAGGAGAGYTIERSLRFNGATDDAYLSRDYGTSTASNLKTWTWSGWVKRSALIAGTLFGSGTDGNNRCSVFFNSANALSFFSRTGTTTVRASVQTQMYFKDTSAWYHIVCVLDAGNSTANQRWKVYVNGVEQALSFSTAVENTNHQIAYSANQIGVRYDIAQEFSGYMAEVNYVNGQTLAPTDFGEYDDNNVWQPKEYTGTYGTGGYYLDFSDNSSTSALGTDSSGSSNNWTTNNFSVAAGSGNDSLIDTPTNYTASGNNGGNYCTWNALRLGTSQTLSNGNLDIGGSGNGITLGTIYVSSGKWYYEIEYATSVSIGIATDACPLAYGSNPASGSFYHYNASGSKFDGTTSSAYGDSYGTSDIIGVAFDADAGTLTFYKNNVSQGTAFTGISGLYGPAMLTNTAGPFSANFGQRPFNYTPPTGYKAWCTTNLPDPTIEDGSTVMDTALYQGGTSPVVSGLNFEPDLIWLKSRTSGGSTFNNWVAVDTVRGAGSYGYKNLYPNTTGTEYDPPSASDASVTAINSDGFNVGGNDNTNWSTSATYASWSWDAGSSTVSNTDGTITSSVRANPSAGFSIVSYSNGTEAAATVGHGLNAVPSFIILRQSNTASNWYVYHKSVGANNYLRLDPDPATAAQSGIGAWNNTAPTSSVFSLGNGTAVNGVGDDHIAYCWAPVEGYSSFGTYEGTGSAAGAFVYTGFRPAFVLIKNMDGPDRWNLFDSTRIGYNEDNYPLFPNMNNTEAGGGFLDLFSNGFKIINQSTVLNSSNETHVYVAFAEHPFKTARAR